MSTPLPPDAWRVNRYVRGLSDDAVADADADAALSGFQRFPAWKWRDTVVRDFVEWLRNHNTGLSPLRLCRQLWPQGELRRRGLVGFSTHRGWVTAASDWHEPRQRKRVRKGLPGSWEDEFHHTGTTRFLLPLRDDAALRSLVASGI